VETNRSLRFHSLTGEWDRPRMRSDRPLGLNSPRGEWDRLLGFHSLIREWDQLTMGSDRPLGLLVQPKM
jgi:hypothetical protein